MTDKEMDQHIDVENSMNVMEGFDRTLHSQNSKDNARSKD